MHITDAVPRFVLAKRADGRKPRTISDYRRCLNPFAAWCEAREITLDNLTRQQFRHYVAEELRDPGRDLADGTVAIHLSNLRTFLNWLQAEQLLESDIASAVEMPSAKSRRRIELPLSPDEIVSLLDACEGDEQAQRDRAMILAFLDTGLRRIEMSRLERQQLNLTAEGDGWLKLLDPKSGALKFSILGQLTVTALTAYLESRDDNSPALWMGRRGPLTVHGISKTIQRRGELSGVTRVHPHLFRKTFATWWMRFGGNEQQLMDLAGWESEEMLRLYVQAGSLEDLLTAHRRSGPVDNLLR